MVQVAYAVARSSSVEPFAPVRRMAGPAPRRVRASTGSDLGRRIGVALLVMALLAAIGAVAAKALDSTLLGFVFADLIFLVGIALRSAVAPSRGPQSRNR